MQTYNSQGFGVFFVSSSESSLSLAISAATASSTTARSVRSLAELEEMESFGCWKLNDAVVKKTERFSEEGLGFSAGKIEEDEEEDKQQVVVAIETS